LLRGQVDAGAYIEEGAKFFSAAQHTLFVITPITWPVLLKTKSPPEGAKFADEHGNYKQHGANAS
jgi:hypothetical protein